MAHKLPDIRYKQIGQNLNVVIGDNAVTFKGTKEELEPIKTKLKSYIEKKTPALLKEINEALYPKTTETAKKVEEAETKRVADKKLTKKKLEEVKTEVKKEEKGNGARNGILSGLINTKVLAKVKDKYFLAGYESVAMPELLVERFIDFVQLKRDVEPLMNFWMLCLLNPNKVARYKLFAYLSKHRIIITPSGYFVTYRMVKETKTSNVDGIYVDAHTGKFQHIIGQVSRMDRKDCDEDGARDCSKGLHSGSPDFIGIKLGDGYNKGEIKTKAQGGGHGTGYGASNETVTQKFDNTFGNQAVICIINPMHVVSIPNSDTRKMRSSEIFIAKLTTPEEVLNHLTEADYLIFDSEYAGLEAGILRQQLKNAKLEDYSDGSVEKLAGLKDSASKAKLKVLTERLASLNKSVLGDKVAGDISITEMMRVISSRTKHIEAEKPVIKDEKKAKQPKQSEKNTSKVEETKVLEQEKVSNKGSDVKAKKEKVSGVIQSLKDGKGKQTPKAEIPVKTSAKKAGDKKNIPAKAVPQKLDKKDVVQIVDKSAKAGKVKGVDNEAILITFVEQEYAKVKKAKKSPKNFWVLKSKDNSLKKVELAKGEKPATDSANTLLGNLDELYNKSK